MKIHYIQHVSFEGPGYISHWARQKGHRLRCTELFDNQPLPLLEDVDFLILMGGPMSIHDTKQYPWLREEAAYIEKILEAEIPLLGICLGAQQIAHVLGSRVKQGKEKEIGWFPIERHELAPDDFPLPSGPVFHWHGETFEIPEKAAPLAWSKACLNQGFLYRKNVAGLQFHLESTRESVASLVENEAAELTQGSYVQRAEKILRNDAPYESVNRKMTAILDYLAPGG